MPSISRLFVRAALALGAVVAAAPLALALPPNFVSTPIASGWNQALGICFDHDSRMFVWEKGGRVWNVENGVKGAAPLIDISEEVGDWRDFGLLGFAVDPDFETNGLIYLMYVVDYHHLRYFGTPQYNPNANEYFRDTIGRITRYQCDPATGFRTVLPASRTILVGESITTGFPICHQSHGIGSLVFGEDGALLASCGDGASYETTDVGGPQSGSSNTALAEGIIRQAENVGAYRAQLVDGLSGKILRLDPATGNGIPSNPWYDAANPRAAKSRVWAMGLRNPYRFTLRPGTGSALPTSADPGTLYIGDVGWNAWEELTVCKSGGLNFGWPAFEGLETQSSYWNASAPNRDAPNPLFGVGGCTQQYFLFRDLIVQDSLLPPSWPNPCDGLQQVPASIPRHRHTRPAIDWSHGGVSRTGIYNGNNAAVINIGAPGSPVSGPQFGGNCAIGGVWYTGTDFPQQYRNTLFTGDYGAQWLRVFHFDASDNPTAVENFEADIGSIVALAHDHHGDGIYYIDYDDMGLSSVRHLTYVDNAPPVAVAAATPYYGPLPLPVQFSSAGSFDPEAQPVTFHWDFGDATAGSDLPNPSHTYRAAQDITAQGTIVARIFSLNPPNPTGGGNWNAEIIRDGDLPPVGNQDSQRQYDTFHNNQNGPSDWIGYSFPQPRQFLELVFQEGKHFGDGGWFDTLGVQYRTGAGPWLDVQNLVVSPLYPGNNGVSFETFGLSFTPVTATDIRIVGDPGGSNNFMSVGELRVLAAPPVPPTGPQRYDATLTVRDSLGAVGTAGLVISPNNTPPSVSIVSPANSSTYPGEISTNVPLTAIVSDIETPGALSCEWRVILHHNNHTHPEPPDFNCSTSAVITPHGAPGDIFYYEFTLLVTDAQGLTSADTHYMFQAAPCPGDANGDHAVNFGDLNLVLSNYGQTGVFVFGDLNHDFVVNFADLNIILGFFGTGC